MGGILLTFLVSLSFLLFFCCFSVVFSVRLPTHTQLVKSQREIAYHNFVALPLYEDMAPWNIVFQGSRMAYIDYDTKDVTYDNIVSAVFCLERGNMRCICVV